MPSPSNCIQRTTGFNSELREVSKKPLKLSRAAGGAPGRDSRPGAVPSPRTALSVTHSCCLREAAAGRLTYRALELLPDAGEHANLIAAPPCGLPRRSARRCGGLDQE